MTACHQLRWYTAHIFRIWGARRRSHPNIQKRRKLSLPTGYRWLPKANPLNVFFAGARTGNWATTLGVHLLWLGQIDYTVAVRLEELKCFIQHEVDSEALQHIKPTHHDQIPSSLPGDETIFRIFSCIGDHNCVSQSDADLYSGNPPSSVALCVCGSRLQRLVTP
jgi:hypothetical protein